MLYLVPTSTEWLFRAPSSDLVTAALIHWHLINSNDRIHLCIRFVEVWEHTTCHITYSFHQILGFQFYSSSRNISPPVFPTKTTSKQLIPDFLPEKVGLPKLIHDLVSEVFSWWVHEPWHLEGLLKTPRKNIRELFRNHFSSWKFVKDVKAGGIFSILILEFIWIYMNLLMRGYLIFFNSEDNQNLHPYEHSAKPWSFGSDISYETTVSSVWGIW